MEQPETEALQTKYEAAEAQRLSASHLERVGHLEQATGIKFFDDVIDRSKIFRLHRDSPDVRSAAFRANAYAEKVVDSYGRRRTVLRHKKSFAVVKDPYGHALSYTDTSVMADVHRYNPVLSPHDWLVTRSMAIHASDELRPKWWEDFL
ncbi:MAG: hypothetical protein MJA29_04135, partial [Candidatus Omnitrophica bacterium]|nr:hypothetical protein [Candidatus Omnitrophota bacterium]